MELGSPSKPTFDPGALSGGGSKRRHSFLCSFAGRCRLILSNVAPDAQVRWKIRHDLSLIQMIGVLGIPRFGSLVLRWLRFGSDFIERTCNKLGVGFTFLLCG